MDFEQHDREVCAVKTLAEARKLFEDAMNNAEKTFAAAGDEKLASLFPKDDPIMPGQPRIGSITALMDHTAHHRGGLAVYARLLGKPAPMPYM